MAAWWASLSSLNQTFYALAVFFSALFAWQLVSSFSALGETEAGIDDVDASVDDVDAPDAVEGDAGVDDLDGDDFDQDSESVATFRLLSIRSILAFGTLFSWAGALYLQRSLFPGLALLRALLWGLAGMVTVALFFWLLPRLTEEGTANLDTAVGQVGTVYLDIPEDGAGQVKVLVSGTVSFVRARSRDGRYLPAGTGVRVIGRLDGSTIEVEPVEA